MRGFRRLEPCRGVASDAWIRFGSSVLVALMFGTCCDRLRGDGGAKTRHAKQGSLPRRGSAAFDVILVRPRCRHGIAATAAQSERFGRARADAERAGAAAPEARTPGSVPAPAAHDSSAGRALNRCRAHESSRTDRARGIAGADLLAKLVDGCSSSLPCSRRE